MKQVKFSTLGEEVSFDHNGDPIASYDLMNWQRGQDGSLRLVKVGFYDASLADGRDLVINESVIQWPVGKQVRPISQSRCLVLRFLLSLFFVVFLTSLKNIKLAFYKLHLASLKSVLKHFPFTPLNTREMYQYI